MKKIYSFILLGSILLSGYVQPVFAMRQPAMERSLIALQNAERLLKRASPNKGGHRVNALRYIRKAIKEVRQGIKHANRRPAGGQLKQGKEMQDSRRRFEKGD